MDINKRNEAVCFWAKTRGFTNTIRTWGKIDGLDNLFCINRVIMFIFHSSFYLKQFIQHVSSFNSSVSGNLTSMFSFYYYNRSSLHGISNCVDVANSSAHSFNRYGVETQSSQ